MHGVQAVNYPQGKYEQLLTLAQNDTPGRR